MNHSSRRRGEECLSDLMLDKLVAGDVSPDVGAGARAHADGCQPCRARWTELSAQQQSVSMQAPSELRAALARAPRVRAVPAPRRRAVLGGLSAAAAACCALLLFQRLGPREAVPTGERLKGAGRLGFFVQRGGQLTRGGPGELLRPGDGLQFTFFAPQAGYLMVLGRDASGKVSVYYPSGEQAAPVAPGEQTLPESTLLDHTLGEESLEAVFCTGPRTVEVLRAARERAAAAELEGCSVDILRVVKEAR